MADIINMPRLSDTMEEGTVSKWLKKKGDKVEEGDILAEIETDKATMEFESYYEGTLLHIAVQEGETADVDKLLAIIGEEDEDISDILNGKDSDDKKDSSEDSKDDDNDSKDEDDSDDKKDSSKDSDDDDQSEESDSDDGYEIPEEVVLIKMPRLSDTMEEGSVATWEKKEGDAVEEGDVLAEIETDKATMEFESYYEGTLLHIAVKEGETAPVDELLAIIGPEDTDVSKVLDNLKSGKKSKSNGKTNGKQKSKSSEEDSSTDESSKSEETDSEETKKEGGRILASPLAKKMAADKGIDLSDLKGSGDNGRIVKRDIENYKPSAKPEKAPSEKSTSKAQAYVPAGEEHFEEVKNSQMRKTIAKRLSESIFSAPHYYLTIEVDMENAMASRKAINGMPDTKVSFNDMVVKASAMALRKHPRVNSQYTKDTTKFAEHIHMGVAVAVDDGLVVPVLRFADQLSLTQIGAKVKDLASKAHDKKIQPDEMQGSTFTVSNLGMFGIQEFTSIINQPNSAILSVGAIEEKPVVKDGEIRVGHTMKLTMGCDHRTVDGATGAKFLQTLKTYLENPVTMLA